MAGPDERTPMTEVHASQPIDRAGAPNVIDRAGAPSARVYRVFPAASVVLYNGVTLAHFGLGALGLLIGFETWPTLAWILAGAYLVFALGQMYILMPLKVCPTCVYRRMDGARCVSGLNLVSARLAPPRDRDGFPERARGAFCHNNLYMASLIAPLVLIAPALVIAFSWALVGIFAAVAVLLVLRMFVIFPRVACGHCVERGRCPNAQAMGIR
jgi:hypothetical protein